MLNRFQNVLQQLDIYGQQVTFSFKQQQLYKTSLGGCVSILLLAIVISFFYSNIISFFSMDQVTSENSYFFSSNPPLLELNPNNFMFAVQIEQDDFTTNPYFNITVEQRHYKRYENGTQIKMPVTYIDLVPCTLQHFLPQFKKYNIEFAEEFQKQNIQNFLCPNLLDINSINYFIGGQWSSQDYYFLKFSVTQCQENQKTNQFTWKPQCKTQSEINSVLQSSGNFRFQLFTTNYIVNPNQPSNYIQPYLAIDQFYTFIPDQMFVQSDIFMKGKNIETDQGILMYPNVNTETIGYREESDMRSQFEINRLTPGYYAAFYLNRSPYTYNIKRSFLKLDQLLSYLGGFVQFMIVVMGILVKFYNKQHYMISLANELFEFDKEGKNPITGEIVNFCSIKENFKRQKRLEKMYRERLVTSDQHRIQINQSSSKLYPSPKQIKITQSPLQKQLSSFERYKAKSKQIKSSIWLIISLIFQFKFMMNDEAILLQKAVQNQFYIRDHVMQELDIVFLINKTHEIQKLIKVLFSNEQETLFNVSHKPKISVIQQQKRRKTLFFSLYQKEYINVEIIKQFQDLVEAYKIIMTQSAEAVTEEEIKFNERLTYLLGGELINILEKEIQQMDSIEEDPQPEDEQAQVQVCRI